MAQGSLPSPLPPTPLFSFLGSAFTRLKLLLYQTQKKNTPKNDQLHRLEKHFSCCQLHAPNTLSYKRSTSQMKTAGLIICKINICHYSIPGLFVKGKTHLPVRCPCCEVAVLPLNGPPRLRGLILPGFGSRITSQGY